MFSIIEVYSMVAPISNSSGTCVHAKLLHLRPTLCDPPGLQLARLTVHGILQSRMLE